MLFQLRAADRLRGEECDALVVSQPPSCLVATTTATVAKFLNWHFIPLIRCFFCLMSALIVAASALSLRFF